DFGEYWRHRLQHRLSWWWALHSVHHDQRQMTLWTDNRNHVLDDILAAVWSGTIALMIGVPPAEYPLVMIAFRLVENFSHTNVRLGLRRLGAALAPLIDRRRPGFVAAFSRRQPQQRERIRNTAAG